MSGSRIPGFALFWSASTVTAVGSYVTTVAVGVLVAQTLGGDALDQGWVNAARWAPYLLVGLLAGVVADRLRRKPLLVGTGLGGAFAVVTSPGTALTAAAALIAATALGLAASGFRRADDLPAV